MKSDEKNEDLERRNRELGEKFSNMQLQKMSIEATNEVHRAEIDRLRDDLTRERGQLIRDKESLKRHHENMTENVKLDHGREVDKLQQMHQAEVDKQNGV